MRLGTESEGSSFPTGRDLKAFWERVYNFYSILRIRLSMHVRQSFDQDKRGSYQDHQIGPERLLTAATSGP